MKKVYEAHENEYRRMQQQGIASWSERMSRQAIDPGDLRFLEDVMAQSWAPEKGKVLEMGCGTGPILQWFGKQGFSGLGLDVSATAIKMAKSRNQNSKLQFKVGDVCRMKPDQLQKYSICLDGFLMHCLTEPVDRKKVYQLVEEVLKPDGIFILMTMCSPINRSLFHKLFPQQKIRNKMIYVPHSGKEKYREGIFIKGREYIPVRVLLHWKDVLREAASMGFVSRLFRHNRYTEEEPISFFGAVLVKKY